MGIEKENEKMVAVVAIDDDAMLLLRRAHDYYVPTTL